MSWVKIAILGLELIKWMIGRAEERKIIQETERRLLVEGLLEVSKAAGIASDVRAKYLSMSDSDLLASGTADDYRD